MLRGCPWGWFQNGGRVTPGRVSACRWTAVLSHCEVLTSHFPDVAQALPTPTQQVCLPSWKGLGGEGAGSGL